MDFFQNQETARRKTGLLIVYFVVAVVSIILLSYAIVSAALLLTGSRRARSCIPGSISGIPACSRRCRWGRWPYRRR